MKVAVAPPPLVICYSNEAWMSLQLLLQEE